MDIDKEILSLEPEHLAGTIISRVLVGVDIMNREGLVPSSKQYLEGGGIVWVLGVGRLNQPKAYFYGHTIEDAVTRAKKVVLAGDLQDVWGIPVRKLATRGKKIVNFTPRSRVVKNVAGR